MVGIRGPYGNWFPHEGIRGKNLLFVGGGIGMAPLRSLLNYCLDRRSDYGHIDIFYGARTPGDLCYTYEFDEWRQAPDTSLYLTVDRGGRAVDRQGRRGANAMCARLGRRRRARSPSPAAPLS